MRLGSADPRARTARELAPRGGDEWLEAVFHELNALYQLWRPAEIEPLATSALAVIDELRRPAPDARASTRAPLSPFAAGCAAGIESHLARLDQSRGEHELALARLDRILADLARGEVSEARGHAARALLDSARSLLVLGRAKEAAPRLETLRDRYAGTLEGASASVLLQSVEGCDAYRGKYQGDAAFRRRRSELAAKLPAARRRVAGRLGLEEGAIPRSPFGFVDGLPGEGGIGGLTSGDLAGGGTLRR